MLMAQGPVHGSRLEAHDQRAVELQSRPPQSTPDIEKSLEYFAKYYFYESTQIKIEDVADLGKRAPEKTADPFHTILRILDMRSISMKSMEYIIRNMGSLNF